MPCCSGLTDRPAGPNPRRMRRSLATACLGLVPALAALADAPAATPESGGVAAPDALPAEATGGAAYGRGRRWRRWRWRAPLLAAFAVRGSRLYLYGEPAQVSFRIRSHVKLTHVRIHVVPRGSRLRASTIRLGPRRAGRRHTVALTGRENGILPEGSYRVAISARAARGRRMRRGAGVSAAGDLTVRHHRFPLAGSFTYGGSDARFGAPRGDHTHRGQDLAAAEGTPVLAPRGGVVKAVQYQAAGAGHYVVLDGAGEDLDYVFMHLRTGSIAVRERQAVHTGQRLAEVGNSGRSFGAHLHFEIWRGGGWYSGGWPVDPLPLLKAWQSPS